MRVRGLLVIMAVGAGCDASPTRVDLHVRADPSWSLDRYDVSIGDTTASTDAVAQLEVLLPDDMAGSPHPIAVHGLTNGVAIAHGATSVTPILGASTTATIDLVAGACGAGCDAGTAACRDGGVSRCELQVDGCLGWSAPAPCVEPTPHCSNGACSNACADECAVSEKRCDGTQSYRTCGAFDADPCRDWSEPTGCTVPPPATCLSSSTLRRYAGPGSCAGAGACTYPHVDSTCANGCSNGECKPPVPQACIDFCDVVIGECDFVFTGGITACRNRCRDDCEAEMDMIEVCAGASCLQMDACVEEIDCI